MNPRALECPSYSYSAANVVRLLFAQASSIAGTFQMKAFLIRKLRAFSQLLENMNMGVSQLSGSTYPGRFSRSRRVEVERTGFGDRSGPASEFASASMLSAMMTAERLRPMRLHVWAARQK
jgi:hypothetical protein